MQRIIFQKVVGIGYKTPSAAMSTAFTPTATKYQSERVDVQPLFLNNTESFANGSDFQSFYGGLFTKQFSPDVVKILSRPIDVSDVEIRPDGLMYLPEIKYRRILNEAFGPGNWKLVPRSEHYKYEVGTQHYLERDYALICDSTFVSQARGSHDFRSMKELGNAVESVKSNALTRCCKDLGIASELWDPISIAKIKAIKKPSSSSYSNSYSTSKPAWKKY